MKSLSEQLGIADEFAYRAHRGQLRFDGKTPYYVHPERIANKFKAKQDLEAAVVAFAHDILEDSVYKADDLLSAGIAPHLVKAIEILTKQPGEDYQVYLARVKENTLARKVKVADILDNLGDTPTRGMIIKYAYALLFLLAESELNGKPGLSNWLYCRT
jgi:(p)ppGpp synthase/HD superfamily hydrolase